MKKGEVVQNWVFRERSEYLIGALREMCLSIGIENEPKNSLVRQGWRMEIEGFSR
jgi:hypothetical protein